MLKKTVMVAVLAAAAFFVAPLAASAAGYVPEGNVTVSGSQTPGGVVTISFSDGSFQGGEQVTGSVSGDPTATIAVVRTGVSSTSKAASSAGAVAFTATLPSTATGSYAFTATGAASGTVGTATITIAAADGGLPNTGSQFPVLLAWTGGGVLALGAALVVVMTVVRRQRLRSA